jgi:hypothetical protein
MTEETYEFRMSNGGGFSIDRRPTDTPVFLNNLEIAYLAASKCSHGNIRRTVTKIHYGEMVPTDFNPSGPEAIARIDREGLSIDLKKNLKNSKVIEFVVHEIVEADMVRPRHLASGRKRTTKEYLEDEVIVDQKVDRILKCI